MSDDKAMIREIKGGQGGQQKKILGVEKGLGKKKEKRKNKKQQEVSDTKE